MKRDLFIYLNETRRIVFQVLDDLGQPIDFDTTDVSFQSAKEFYTYAIEDLSIGNGITILDSVNGIVELLLTASFEKGYCAGQHVYQIVYVDKATGTQLSVCLSGRLFIDPTIMS